MKIWTGLLSYLTVLTAVVGGAAGAFIFFAPDPGVGQTASAEVRQAPVPPKIAAWQARKAIPDPPEPTKPVLSVTSYPQVKTGESIVRTERAARVKPNPTKELAERAPPADNQVALGYAAVPAQRFYEQPFSVIRDRHGN